MATPSGQRFPEPATPFRLCPPRAAIVADMGTTYRQPKHAASGAKTGRAVLRAEEQEIATWKAAAKRAGLGLSAWLRILANDGAKRGLRLGPS